MSARFGGVLVVGMSGAAPVLVSNETLGENATIGAEPPVEVRGATVCSGIVATTDHGVRTLTAFR